MIGKLSIPIYSASIIGMLVLAYVVYTKLSVDPQSSYSVAPHLKEAFASYRYIIPLLGDVDDPDISPDGEKLTFTGKNWKIWTSDINGRNLRQVSNLKWDANPTWSPDGKKIAFQSYGRFGRDFRIWVVDADGKNLRQLEDDPNPGKYGQQYPQWSPDGLHLVWSEGDRGLRIADVDGKNGRNLTRFKTFQLYLRYGGGSGTSI